MSVFCFDFDGVVCDSAPETALSAWRACRELWLEMPEQMPAATLQRFCRLRPVMHTGFEAIPLMRLIVLGNLPDERFFAGWDTLRDAWIQESGLAKPDLLKRFGAQRDQMIAMDATRWLNLNPFYESMARLLTSVARQHEVFIVTTKQERFARLLLTHHKVPLDEERVFGLERNLAKPTVLRELLGRPSLSGQDFHFIEDRLETLQDVILQRPLDAVKLYLVDWGYNTPDQRQTAAQEPRIEVVTRDRLRQVCSA